MEIIKTEELTKKYRNIVAVENVSLHVAKGDIYVFPGLKSGGAKQQQ